MALTNQEKIDVVNTHIKNIEISKYNLELMVKYQQESTTPDQEKIGVYQGSIVACDNQLAVLASELAELSL